MRFKSWGSKIRIATLVLAMGMGSAFWLNAENQPEPEPQVGVGQVHYFLSPEKEAEMGIQEFEKLKQSKKIVRSGSQHEMVQRVASRMVPLVRVPNAKWEFVVFDDDSPNAFALPGGKVGVHTGLFKVANNETQLAAVLGHELAHVTEGHAGKRIKTAGIALGAATIGGLILNKKTGNDKAGAIATGAATLGVLQFSRSQELEADHEGTLLMARAGYDPRQAITLWEQFAAFKSKSGNAGPPGFLSTHPVDSRRIEELQALMPEAMKLYKPGNSSSAVSAQSPSSSTSSSAVAAEAPRLDSGSSQEEEASDIPKAQKFFEGIFRARRPE